MKLKKNSIEWAFKHLLKLGDTDIFPKLQEIEILNEIQKDFIHELSNKDIENMNIGTSRKMIVPKDDLSYRICTQLDPVDSIILSSIIYEYGQLIENIRLSKSEDTVFSYRFAPDDEGHYFTEANSWNRFWTSGYSRSEEKEYVLILDIADFYNQIYHHSVENILDKAGIPTPAIKWIIKLLSTTTSKVSRGIPVGPHSIHLIAEAILTTIDNSLKDRGIDFIRYVDDYIIFCKTEIEARKNNLIFADIIDKQQRLIVQKQKTRIISNKEFKELCDENIEDRPINHIEENILKIIKKHSDNPYAAIMINDLTDDEIKEFSIESISAIVEEYLSKEEPNYIRLRWFLRRLSQVGHPSALKYLIQNKERMLPALNDIFRYINSVENANYENWPEIGEDLLAFMENEMIEENLYYLLILFSLFNKKPIINHYPNILKKYSREDAVLKREIILTAYTNNCYDWLRELKENYKNFDPWQKRAYIIALRILPKDEKKFFIRNYIDNDKILDKYLAKWSNN